MVCVLYIGPATHVESLLATAAMREFRYLDPAEDSAVSRKDGVRIRRSQQYSFYPGGPALIPGSRHCLGSYPLKILVASIAGSHPTRILTTDVGA